MVLLAAAALFYSSSSAVRPVRFTADVLPVLTKGACNSGACHGAGAGRGGFKLSLLGYDPDADYEAITRLGSSRRVSPSDPANSLILRKATLQMRHNGGLRFKADSPEYRILRNWIDQGLVAPREEEPRVVRLEATPKSRDLPLGGTQQIRVRATFSDKTVRDVTYWSHFTTNDGDLVAVSRTGDAKAIGPGEGAVVARYRGSFTTARIICAFGPKTAETPSATGIDTLVFGKLASLGLKPSPSCTDAEFIRRASLDVAGVLPTPERIRGFMADRSPNKRQALVDELLQSGEYVEFWTLKWSDMLRNTRHSLSPRAMYAFHHWIRQSVAANLPWDTFVRELVAGSGSSVDNGAVNFLRAGIEPRERQISTPEDLGETTAQLFLGVRLQCARCHNHPFEKWTQSQFYSLASYFGRVTVMPGERKDEQVVYSRETGEVGHPKTGAALIPVALDGPALSPGTGVDRRTALADWMTAPDNPFFARVIANRIWRHYMGRGLVEPVDDLRVSNPPSNEPLMLTLEKQVRADGYDLKKLMRLILLSKSYQLSSRATPANQRDTRYYSHFLVKRMGAEQLLDAIGQVTGVPESFKGYPAGTLAMQLPDTQVVSSFLDTFGRPARQTTCECERSFEPSVAQALHMLNNEGVNARIASSKGRIAKLLAAKSTPAEIVDELYLASVGRLPSPSERARQVASLTKADKPAAAAEDLLWALMNTKEFLFNH